MTVRHQLMLYANAVCLLGENRNPMKKNTEAVLVASMETGVVLNAKKANVTGDAWFKTRSQICSTVGLGWLGQFTFV